MKSIRMAGVMCAALLTVTMGVRSAHGQLPDPGMEIDPDRTAVVITDPQNDFLSPNGVAWGLVGESVTENNTIENIETLLKTAREYGIRVFISPHYYYPRDHGWRFEGHVRSQGSALDGGL